MSKNIDFILTFLKFDKNNCKYEKKYKNGFTIFVDEKCELSFSKPIKNFKENGLNLKRRIDRCVLVYIDHFLNMEGDERDITLFSEVDFSENEKMVFEVEHKDMLVKVIDCGKKEERNKYRFHKEFDFARRLKDEGRIKVIQEFSVNLSEKDFMYGSVCVSVESILNAEKWKNFKRK